MKFLSNLIKRFTTPKVHPDIIEEVQSILDVAKDGVAGLQTWIAIGSRLGLTPEDCNSVASIQRAVGVDADGIPGPKTWHAILARLWEMDDSKPVNVSGISKAAYDLIIKYEVGGGVRYYNKALKSPTWPGGASGVTIGIGYDLGYNTKAQFQKDWAGVLDKKTYDRLAEVLGATGESAATLIHTLKDISISWQAAEKVFQSSTLPRFIGMTKKAFPGSDSLPPDVFGALVSIVFNRGASTSGASRKEMKNIKDAISGKRATDDLPAYIADQIVSMKRLWENKGLDGLLTRRDAEAALVQKSSKRA